MKPIIDYVEEGFINITFPDFGNVCTCVKRDEDYIAAAQKVFALAIMDIEESGGNLPEQQQTEEVEIRDNQKLVYVNVWMPYHRTQVKVVYVKKTLKIPAWLDELAKANNINFSATLVKTIKSKLNLN